MRVMLEQWLGGRPSALRMGSTRQLRSWICSVARRIPSSASLGLPDCSKLDMLGLQDTYTVANERILGLKLPEICYLICRNPSICPCGSVYRRAYGYPQPWFSEDSVVVCRVDPSNLDRTTYFTKVVRANQVVTELGFNPGEYSSRTRFLPRAMKPLA